VHIKHSFSNIQEGVAIEIAEAVVGALRGELAATAVNAPMVPAEVNTTMSVSFSIAFLKHSSFPFRSLLHKQTPTLFFLQFTDKF